MVIGKSNANDGIGALITVPVAAYAQAQVQAGQQPCFLASDHRQSLALRVVGHDDPTIPVVGVARGGHSSSTQSSHLSVLDPSVLPKGPTKWTPIYSMGSVRYELAVVAL